MPGDPNKPGDRPPKIGRRDIIAYLRAVLEAESEIGETSVHLIRMTIDSLEQEEIDIVFVDSG